MFLKPILFLIFSLNLIIVENEIQSQIQYSSELKIRFLDEETGYNIIPDFITIQNREKKTTDTFHKKQIANNTLIKVPLTNGIYDINVTANGYKGMSTFFYLNNQSLNVNFNLVPLVPSMELSSKYIQSFHQSDALVIVGYVVDDSTGEALNDVAVYSSDKVAITSTNSEGFFKLILPLASDYESLEKRGTIIFEKISYLTESRINFDMWPRGDIILRIRMKKGTGLHKMKIIQNRDANRIILDEK